MHSTLERKNRIYAAAAVLFWIAVWQFASMIIGEELFLPSPISVVRTFLELVTTGEFYRAVAGSFLRIGSGFALGLLSGELLALLALWLQPVRVLLRPLMSVIRSIPVASFVILALIMVGSRQLALLISFLMVLPVIYTNTLTGLLSADGELLEVAEIFGVSRARRLLYIYFPAAAAHISAGMTIALGLCWKSGVAAEVIGLTAGSLGRKLYDSKINLNISELFAYTVVIVAVSWGFEKLVQLAFSRLRRRFEGVVPWQQR